MVKNEKIKVMITDSIFTKQNLDVDKIELIANKIISMYKKGGKLLIGGNGGSASDAQHFSGELLARFKTERKSLPAIALHTDTSTLTAWSNDYDFNSYYARLIDGFGETKDIFFAISTSGNSKNLIAALKKCKEKGIYSIGLLGKDGGEMKVLCDMFIIVSSNDTPRIQESHILIIHIICQLIDDVIIS
ncbi:MAG: SIS domain-containing protein [Candidatus Woesearchaeota archaeon]